MYFQVHPFLHSSLLKFNVENRQKIVKKIYYSDSKFSSENLLFLQKFRLNQTPPPTQS